MKTFGEDCSDCPPPVPILAIVLGVIAGIVILGLILLLVWKLLTVLHDRAEFAKFDNERLMAKWDTVRSFYLTFLSIFFDNWLSDVDLNWIVIRNCG
ncbi:unnamed protein product [Anisakis simplex]|uniref:Integrin beta-like protein 1 (inferred by orthology to a human protein) n=1 Tax=Anisakis simplex TaxID=6269 RepID=A0A0M3J9S0_ANISI|nr:unnamed protein product [Anisakis simplex]